MHARKLTGGGKSLLTGPPATETVLQHYDEQLLGDGDVSTTLSLSEEEPDVEVLLPEGLTSLDGTSTFDELNPYTSADALRLVAWRIRDLTERHRR